MTMGNQWSYKPDDQYKTSTQLIHLLVDIVAKGGNFLLNIGPSPQGELPPDSLRRLKEIGDWMQVNGSAIYSTRPIAPYKEGVICFTCMPGGGINAIYLAGEQEKQLPSQIEIKSFCPAGGTQVKLLGVTSPLKWDRHGRGVLIHVPGSVQGNPPCRHAWTFQIEKPEM